MNYVSARIGRLRDYLNHLKFNTLRLYNIANIKDTGFWALGLCHSRRCSPRVMSTVLHLRSGFLLSFINYPTLSPHRHPGTRVELAEEVPFSNLGIRVESCIPLASVNKASMQSYTTRSYIVFMRSSQSCSHVRNSQITAFIQRI